MTKSEDKKLTGLQRKYAELMVKVRLIEAKIRDLLERRSK